VCVRKKRERDVSERKKEREGGKVKLMEGKKETNTRVNEMNGGVSGGRARGKGEDFAANEKKGS